MSERVRPRPDGTIEVNGEAYRVTERGGDRCEIHRDRDHVLVGSFVLPRGDEEHPEVTVEAGHAEALVRAVALAWSGPKGLMPLQ
jgi:hypothetical protein